VCVCLCVCVCVCARVCVCVCVLRLCGDEARRSKYRGRLRVCGGEGGKGGEGVGNERTERYLQPLPGCSSPFTSVKTDLIEVKETRKTRKEAYYCAGVYKEERTRIEQCATSVIPV
jgi:hypothetical protein